MLLVFVVAVAIFAFATSVSAFLVALFDLVQRVDVRIEELRVHDVLSRVRRTRAGEALGMVRLVSLLLRGLLPDQLRVFRLATQDAADKLTSHDSPAVLKLPVLLVRLEAVDRGAVGLVLGVERGGSRAHLGKSDLVGAAVRRAALVHDARIDGAENDVAQVAGEQQEGLERVDDRQRVLVCAVHLGLAVHVLQQPRRWVRARRLRRGSEAAASRRGRNRCAGAAVITLSGLCSPFESTAAVQHHTMSSRPAHHPSSHRTKPDTTKPEQCKRSKIGHAPPRRPRGDARPV